MKKVKFDQQTDRWTDRRMDRRMGGEKEEERKLLGKRCLGKPHPPPDIASRLFKAGYIRVHPLHFWLPRSLHSHSLSFLLWLMFPNHLHLYPFTLVVHPLTHTLALALFLFRSHMERKNSGKPKRVNVKH